MFSTIPVIDMASARLGAGDRERAVRKIDQANRTVGFFNLVNHGIGQRLLDDLYGVTADFFDLPGDQKMRYVRPRRTSRGYVPPKQRALAHTRGKLTPGDLVELFAMGLPQVPNETYYAPEFAGDNFAKNVWPSEITEMERIWTDYYEAMTALSIEVMALFAEALSLPSDFFSNKIDKHISNLFANCYPPIIGDIEEGQVRVGEHTDYGTLTLLYQKDEVGGLEVFIDGVWRPVPATPDAFVVNIGDLMARWTNDEWISTLHRVRNPPPGQLHLRRISLPFFCQPNYDTVISTLPSCADAKRPNKYPPITSGENMRRKTATSFERLEASN